MSGFLQDKLNFRVVLLEIAAPNFATVTPGAIGGLRDLFRLYGESFRLTGITEGNASKN